MKPVYLIILLTLLILPLSVHSEEKMTKIYEFKCKTLSGKEVSLEDYKGKVLLIVNTASKCGLTPQYKELEQLYKDKKDDGLIILGFPCNQFGGQEPGTEQEISEFCQLNYGVTFPMFEKIDVNGDKAHPLYKYLKAAAPGFLGSQSIKWNFTKFLIDRSGQKIIRYSPTTSPSKMTKDIDQLLTLKK